jgi:NADH-ubiquinone oxidoreductase chain 6
MYFILYLKKEWNYFIEVLVNIFILSYYYLMDLLLPVNIIKTLLPILAIIAGIFVISTKNPIISVFNLIVLYILVAFYLIFIGLTYLGISYIVVYIGAIAILFLFVIMMIDVEVVEKRNSNYLPLLFLLLGGFLYTLKNCLYNLGLIKMKSLSFIRDYICLNDKINIGQLFNIRNNIRNEFKLDFNTIKEIDNNLIIKNNLSNDSWIVFINDYNFYNENNIHKLTFNLWNNEYINDNIISGLNEDNIFNNNVENVEYLRYNILSTNVWEIDSIFPNINQEKNNNYLLIITDWDSIINKITQITTIGDILYTLYHSYIYILSVILLLGMIGAIILTADSSYELRTININKMSNSLVIFYFINYWNILLYINKLTVNIKLYYLKLSNNIFYLIYSLINYNLSIMKYNDIYIISYNNLYYTFNNYKYYINYKIFNYKNNSFKVKLAIPIFFEINNLNNWHSEAVIGNLTYFVLTSIIIAILLLFINSYFSLNIKYLEKGGGFECGFTSFLQTRERFNIIFYRVSLLFLVFDLEIILIYPYPAIYQKNQNISKNNVLAFIYILIIGFIYELKEGALNIVKKGRFTEISNNR